MTRRILYLAVAGALALPASAAPTAEWGFYGTLMLEADNVKISGASTGVSAAPDLTGAANYSPSGVAGRNRLTSGGTNLGFKGSLKISDNLKAIWQVESAVQLDGDTPTTWAGRNTALGLEGSWGTVLAGQWDTPYKNIQQAVQPLRTTTQFDAWILNNVGFNTPPTTTAGAPLTTSSSTAADKKDATFSRRQGNSIQYWSPVVEGFQAKVMYSVDEGKSTTASTPQVNPSLISAHLSYKTGPLLVMYAYECHNDYFGLNRMLGQLNASLPNGASSKDEGHELGAFLTLSTGTRITAVVEQLKYQSDGLASGAVNEYKRVAWHLSVAQSFEAHKVWLAYGQAGAGSSTKNDGSSVATEGMGAKEYTVGYSYAINKVTDAFAAVYGMQNDKSAQYGLYPQVANAACGADTKGYSVGMLYKF